MVCTVQQQTVDALILNCWTVCTVLSPTTTSVVLYTEHLEMVQRQLWTLRKEVVCYPSMLSSEDIGPLIGQQAAVSSWVCRPSCPHNRWIDLRFGIPDKIVSLIRALYNNSVSFVRASQTGVRQGCVLAPDSFATGVDWLLERTVGTGLLDHTHFHIWTSPMMWLFLQSYLNSLCLHLRRWHLKPHLLGSS